MCRALSTYRSMKTVPSPNADDASRRAEAMASASVPGSWTIRIPRPPPPEEALTSTGYSYTRSGSVQVGSIGTPESASSDLASIFEPITAITFAGGPTQVSPASVTAAAKSAFSERKPYPGWIASAPVLRAAAMIRSPRR